MNSMAFSLIPTARQCDFSCRSLAVCVLRVICVIASASPLSFLSQPRISPSNTLRFLCIEPCRCLAVAVFHLRMFCRLRVSTNLSCCTTRVVCAPSFSVLAVLRRARTHSHIGALFCRSRPFHRLHTVGKQPKCTTKKKAKQ